MPERRGFKALVQELKKEQARKQAATPKQAKGMLGEIGSRMQASRGARAPRKQAKGVLGAVGSKLNASLKNL